MIAVRRSIIGAAFAGLVAATVVAPASADGSRAGPSGPPVYAPPLIWTGFYVGAHLGYAFVDAEAEVSGFGSSVGVEVSDNDAVGGLQVGYNWQRGPYVLGVEADIDFISDLEFGTVRGRLGVIQDNLLFYGTAGIAFADGEPDSTTGFVIGGGVEFDLSHHWRPGLTAGIEALYVGFEEESGTVSTGLGPIRYSADADAIIVRGRLNYHFR